MAILLLSVYSNLARGPLQDTILSFSTLELTASISAKKLGTKQGGEPSCNCEGVKTTVGDRFPPVAFLYTHRIQSRLSRHIPTPRLQSDSDLFQVVNNARD